MATNFQCFWGLLLLISLYVIHSSPTPHVYIVYLGRKCHDDPKLTSKHHVQLLSSVFSSEEDAKQSMLYSYKHSFSGFSTILNSSQAAVLAKRKEVISLFKSKMMHSHTTRSWDFLGLSLTNTYKHHTTPLQLAYGHDIIVGIIDSGVWPESDSFKEEPGMKPIPSRWRGECERGEKFNPKRDCNRKLIGARYYSGGFEAEYGSLQERNISEYRSARDFAGHGTHTASTAAGSIAKGASFQGLAKGIARGGAPRARVAVYKACWGYEVICSEADVLKAFDDALFDGVDVISASFGRNPPFDGFFNYSSAIGSFHAMQVGVTVVLSAGNSGPTPGLVSNVQPWAISVAASSIDRTYPTRIVVEGNYVVVGESFSFIDKPITKRLVIPTNYFSDSICNESSALINMTRPGRVLLCFSDTGGVSITFGDAVRAALKIKASALIFAEPVPRPEGPDLIPTIRIDFIQGDQLRKYQQTFTDGIPKVKIGPTKAVIRKSVAPRVAYFSSRGPSSIEPDILKPDISAPGLNILAAWPTKTPPIPGNGIIDDNRTVEWNFQSGTSMSCPHVSGIVALLKSAHPNWSPAALRSALMTTAYTRDNSLDEILSDGSPTKVSDPFDIGAGHVDPVRAMDPGLVYDMKTSDHILFLCNLGYTQEQIQVLLLPCPSPDLIRCPKSRKPNFNLNYPSITVSNLRSTVTIKRTVRNVGPCKCALYFSSVVEPNGVQVVVWPKVLFFSWFREEVTYHVTLIPRKKSQGRYDFGEIVWSDYSGHKVRSPLVVRVNTFDTTSTTSAAHEEDDDDDDDQLISEA